MVKMTSLFRNKVGTLARFYSTSDEGDGITAGYYMCRYAGCTFEGDGWQGPWGRRRVRRTLICV